METTRRTILKSLAGTAAAIATSTKGAVWHKVLRRPYRDETVIPAHPFKILSAIFVRLECAAPVRVTVTQLKPDEEMEPILDGTLTPRSGERFSLMSVNGARVEWPIRMTVSSKAAVKILETDPVLANPPFRIVDNMIVYHDKFYPARPVGYLNVQAGPRLVARTAPGADVQYGGGMVARNARSIYDENA